MKVLSHGHRLVRWHRRRCNGWRERSLAIGRGRKRRVVVEAAVIGGTRCHAVEGILVLLWMMLLLVVVFVVLRRCQRRRLMLRRLGVWDICDFLDLLLILRFP